MRTYTVTGFAMVTVGVRYAEVEANSEESAMLKAVEMFESGNIQLTQDIDEATAIDFDPMSADIDEI